MRNFGDPARKPRAWPQPPPPRTGKPQRPQKNPVPEYRWKHEKPRLSDRHPRVSNALAVIAGMLIAAAGFLGFVMLHQKLHEMGYDRPIPYRQTESNNHE